MGFLRTRMCVLLKSQRRDQQDYIKAELVAGTPLWADKQATCLKGCFSPRSECEAVWVLLPPASWPVVVGAILGLPYSKM